MATRETSDGRGDGKTPLRPVADLSKKLVYDGRRALIALPEPEIRALGDDGDAAAGQSLLELIHIKYSVLVCFKVLAVSRSPTPPQPQDT